MSLCVLTGQVTGAAPIERSVVEFFMQLDVPIYEMYGMSECTGPHCVSLPSKLTSYFWLELYELQKGLNEQCRG